jgi:hypothetical protein
VWFYIFLPLPVFQVLRKSARLAENLGKRCEKVQSFSLYSAKKIQIIFFNRK